MRAVRAAISHLQKHARSRAVAESLGAEAATRRCGSANFCSAPNQERDKPAAGDAPFAFGLAVELVRATARRCHPSAMGRVGVKPQMISVVAAVATKVKRHITAVSPSLAFSFRSDSAGLRVLTGAPRF